jgi:hypothetical protein
MTLSAGAGTLLTVNIDGFKNPYSTSAFTYSLNVKNGGTTKGDNPSAPVLVDTFTPAKITSSSISALS